MRRVLTREIAFKEQPVWLSLRASPLGGAILDSPELQPPHQISRARRLLILVHGFNVDLCAACRSYETFKERLVLKWRVRSLPLYWPGDSATRLARLRGQSGLTTEFKSKLSYPFQIKRAVRSAEILSSFLAGNIGRHRSRRSRLEINIVAHSLGCRLTLELLKRLRKNDKISVRLAVLMAAAVPFFEVRRNGDLRTAIETPARVLLYRSEYDGVLGAIFRAGQTVERPWLHVWRRSDRNALGRNGWKNCAHEKPRTVTEIVTGNDHSEYWADGNIPDDIASEFNGSHRKKPLRHSLEVRRLPGGRVIEYKIVAPRKMFLRYDPRQPRDICQDCF